MTDEERQPSSFARLLGVLQAGVQPEIVCSVSSSILRVQGEPAWPEVEVTIG